MAGIREWITGLVKPNTVTSNMISVTDLPDVRSDAGWGWSGEKYQGSLNSLGVGLDFEILDLTTIRRRSRKLFQRNMYAAGLIKRLVTNEITKGLRPEAQPDPEITGMTEDQAYDWSDRVERYFDLWASDSRAADYGQEMTFDEMQYRVRMDSLIDGDILVIERTSRRTGLPTYQLVPACQIIQPLDANINTEYGVEVSKSGKHVAYYVLEDDGKVKRIEAYGRRTGRRAAWLVYGSRHRYKNRRGVPLLALIMQSLNELDDYRAAESRAAVVNSILAMFIYKDRETIGSNALTSGAVRRDVVGNNESSENSVGKTQTAREYLPGMMLTELAPGEEPRGFDPKRPNVNYSVFETALLNAIAWSNELPPEILMMMFQNNYSASRAADGLFTVYINTMRSFITPQFQDRVYESWLIGSVLSRVFPAQGMLQSMRSDNYYIFRAWMKTTWLGVVKPSLDPSKDVKAETESVAAGFSTRARSSRILNGTSFQRNVTTLKRENEMLAEAMEPLVKLKGLENGSENDSNSQPDLDAGDNGSSDDNS